jgi:hypothetical protein
VSRGWNMQPDRDPNLEANNYTGTRSELRIFLCSSVQQEVRVSEKHCWPRKMKLARDESGTGEVD